VAVPGDVPATEKPGRRYSTGDRASLPDEARIYFTSIIFRVSSKLPTRSL
jgi:hypothetical protein